MKTHLAAIFFGFVLGLCYPELRAWRHVTR